MERERKNINILVLLIGEVLADPRVYRTCVSLGDAGAHVTVACTNPDRRPPCETHGGIEIRRFPHREDFILKRLYHWFRGRGILRGEGVQPPASAPSKGMIPSHRLRHFLRALNFRHFMKSSRRINAMMVEAFSRERFDLVHCNDVDTLFAGSELKSVGTAGEMLYDSHEYWPGTGMPGSWSNRRLAEIEASLIGNADYVVTVNPLIAKRLREDYDLAVEPSVVLNCPPLYRGAVDTGTVHSPVRVIYQGKMQDYRGLEQLVRAFGMVRDAVLTFSGYGPLRERLENLVRQLDLGSRVFFTGRYEPSDSPALLIKHDIGIITYERVVENNIFSSPNKLFEYAMAGLAIVTSDLPFLAGVVGEHDLGAVIPRIEPERIADTLNRLVSDREHLVTCRGNARRAAVDLYSWERQFTQNYPFALSPTQDSDAPAESSD